MRKAKYEAAEFNEWVCLYFGTRNGNKTKMFMAPSKLEKKKKKNARDDGKCDY